MQSNRLADHCPVSTPSNLCIKICDINCHYRLCGSSYQDNSHFGSRLNYIITQALLYLSHRGRVTAPREADPAMDAYFARAP